MNERPTPEQIQSEWRLNCDLLFDLRSYGYVIVHPDDHPNLGIAIPHQGYMQWRAGYDDCWNDIFGGSHE